MPSARKISASAVQANLPDSWLATSLISCKSSMICQIHAAVPTLRPSEDNLEGEQRQALEQWLGKIPDDPGELLRRKFWYEQQQHQDQGKTR